MTEHAVNFRFLHLLYVWRLLFFSFRQEIITVALFLQVITDEWLFINTSFILQYLHYSWSHTVFLKFPFVSSSLLSVFPSLQAARSFSYEDPRSQLRLRRGWILYHLSLCIELPAASASADGKRDLLQRTTPCVWRRERQKEMEMQLDRNEDWNVAVRGKTDGKTERGEAKLTAGQS